MCWIGAKRASGDFFTDRGDGVTNVPSEGRLPGIDSARVDTRHVSYLRARETAVPTRPGRRRREGRVCDGGRRQWRSRRRAVVMSLGEQRFSSRIGWLSGAPLHFPPLRRVASGKGKVPLSIKSRGCCLASSGARLRQETWWRRDCLGVGRLLVGKRLTAGGMAGWTQHSSHKGSMDQAYCPRITHSALPFLHLHDHIPNSYLCWRQARMTLARLGTDALTCATWSECATPVCTPNFLHHALHHPSETSITHRPCLTRPTSSPFDFDKAPCYLHSSQTHLFNITPWVRSRPLRVFLASSDPSLTCGPSLWYTAFPALRGSWNTWEFTVCID